MGQQQLLLIVLALILVGIATYLAIQLFAAYSEESARDTVIAEVINMATISLQYYQKAFEVGGGSRSFIDWQIPPQLDSTDSGTYSIISTNNTQLILIGSPIQGSGYTWSIKGIVTKDGITTEIM